MTDKQRTKMHELEKRALVGDREAVIQLVSLFRHWRNAGDEMMDVGTGDVWCDPVRTFASKIDAAVDDVLAEGER